MTARQLNSDPAIAEGDQVTAIDRPSREKTRAGRVTDGGRYAVESRQFARKRYGD